MVDKAKNASKPTPKRAGVPPQSVNQADWGGFIDVRMDEASKEAFEAWKTENLNGLWLMFADTLARGMKYSLSYDAANECFISTLTAVVERLSGRRYALTARSASWEDSLFLMLFKHFYLLEEDWGNFRPSQPYNNSWG